MTKSIPEKTSNSRNSKVSKGLVTGESLIAFACDIIAESVKAVGGRYIMIECRENEKSIHFYESNSFREIAHVPDNEQPMVQMVRKIH